MTEELTPNKKKKINWKEKSASDAARISKRLEGRELLSEEATTTNSATLKKVATPTSPSLETRNRLRKKIKEAYDEDDDDENETVFFDVNLLDGEENSNQSSNSPKEEKETLRIIKEQQMVGKLNTIMSANLAAKDLNLPSNLTAEDQRLLNSAEYDIAEIRRQTLKNKITKPLGIEGNIPEKELKQTLQEIKTIQTEVSLEDLAPIKTKDLKETADVVEEKDENEMAKLILEKTGRQLPSISSPLKRKLEKRIAEEYEKRKEKGND